MTSSRRKRTTITEIAAKAGTSTATVSYVLNEKGAVGVETRARVLSAAKALGYKTRPRPVREGDPDLKSLTLAWVNTSPHWQLSWLSSLLNHTILTCLQAQGGRLHTVFCDEEESFLTGKEDALLVAGRPGPSFCKRLPARLPRLNVICQPYPTETPFIDIDHVAIGKTLANYLIERGHRRIGFVSNDRDHPYFEQRYIGYLHALDAAGIPLRNEWILRRHDAPSQMVETAENIAPLDGQLDVLLKKIGTPCALIAANDWVAGAIYQRAQRRGLRVPEDISVVGCDNDPSICRLLSPGLTTHTVPYEEVGREAVQWMLSVLAGRPPHQHPGTWLLRGRLIERQSVLRAG